MHICVCTRTRVWVHVTHVISGTGPWEILRADQPVVHGQSLHNNPYRRGRARSGGRASGQRVWENPGTVRQILTFK